MLFPTSHPIHSFETEPELCSLTFNKPIHIKSYQVAAALRPNLDRRENYEQQRFLFFLFFF